jgi:hypothetical protein
LEASPQDYRGRGVMIDIEEEASAIHALASLVGVLAAGPDADIDGRGCSLKHGRYLDDGLAGLKQVVQFPLLVGGPWPPCWR